MATEKVDVTDEADVIDVPRITGRREGLRSAWVGCASALRSSVLARVDDVDGVGDVETPRFNIVAAKFLC